MVAVGSRLRRRRRRRGVHGRHARPSPGARPDPLQTVDDHRSPASSPLLHDAQAVDERAERRPSGIRSSSSAPDDVDELLAEVGADRAVLNQQAAIPAAAGQAQAHEEARRQRRRRDCRTPRGRESCRLRIELVVEKVQRPSRGKPSSLASAMRIGHAASCASAAMLPARRRLRSAGRSARRHRSRRRPDRARPTVVSSVASPGPLDTRLPSVTMARPTRPVIGEVTCVNSRFSSAARSAASTAATCAERFLRERRAAIVLFVRHRVLGPQPLGAAQLRVGALHGRARARQLGPQPIDLGLERTRVDLEQQVAAADHGAFGEAHRRDEAGHARPDRTESTACSRPVNSSHSVTSRSMTLATVTCGGGGAACCAAVLAHAAEHRESDDHGRGPCDEA